MKALTVAPSILIPDPGYHSPRDILVDDVKDRDISQGVSTADSDPRFGMSLALEDTAFPGEVVLFAILADKMSEGGITPYTNEVKDLAIGTGYRSNGTLHDGGDGFVI
jgi:hypothetical protein